MADKKAGAGDTVVIKKYANRRLYNTATSAYVTLEDLAKMVREGTDFVVFDIPKCGRVGVSNCYDMWFPETTRTLAAMGAEVILHPSMTNTIDRDVELAIARASAAINQVCQRRLNTVRPVRSDRWPSTGAMSATISPAMPVESASAWAVTFSGPKALPVM